MIVCVCNAITEHELREVAGADARTPEAAYAKVGCEPQCGCCLDYAQEIVDEELAARRPPLRIVA
jgi:bacterioferritin-associated ferredoxin